MTSSIETSSLAMAGSPRAGWRETWVGWRNHLLASPAFQRWASRFRLTRPLARRRAGALFDIVAGFVYTQVLTACVRLGLFAMLAEGALTVVEIAARAGLSVAAADRLLKAAASLKLTERLPDGRYALGIHGAALRGNPSLVAMIEHHAMLYDDLADPVALLRSAKPDGRLARYWAYAKHEDPTAVAPERARAYSNLMAESQALVADEVLDSYPLKSHKRLLDIGGGAGAFLSAVAKRTPGLALTLFDLPAVAPLARARFAAEGLEDRATVVAGSFFADDLPRGADVASLVRVLHDHDDDDAMAILARARAALPEDGVLLVAEPMAGTPGAEAMGDAYFGLYLAAMGSGRPRAWPELKDMLGRAGFSRARLVPTRTPLITRLIVARR